MYILNTFSKSVKRFKNGPEACRLSYDFGSPAREADIDSMGIKKDPTEWRYVSTILLAI